MSGPTDYVAARRALLARSDLAPAARRAALSGLTDHWLAWLYETAGGEKHHAALIAVGGYGRRELAPGSDLDLLLLHRGEVGGLPDAIWYPVWDAGLRLDHSVRDIAGARRLAAADLKVLLGLLDARTIAGDDGLRARLLESVLSDWRGLATRRLPELRALVDERIERDGELAHLLEPNLKEAYGGLRDLSILRALAATWLTDAPHSGLAEPQRLLLDTRDALHLVELGRGARVGDRLLMQEQDAVAGMLGYDDALQMMRELSAAGRAIGYASDETWYRLGRASGNRRGRLRLRRSSPQEQRRPLANGVVEHDGEVVLASDARPGRDPVLVLRAAAAAARRGIRMSPHTLSRLAEESAPMPTPWPRSARESLAALLGSGRPAIAVWEGLDQVGLIERLIPEWGPIRSAPQRNPVHRFTVDRHLVETAVAAGRFQRRVSRPDLLLFGALLHDIGKGRGDRDHSEVGAELLGRIGPVLGFDEPDLDVLHLLVRHHLLLPEVATRRDLDDPDTVRAVARTVGTVQNLELLHYLTLADAAATGPKAWSSWKGALVADLVARTRAALVGDEPPAPPPIDERYEDLIAEPGLAVAVSSTAAGTEVAVAADDRAGLLSLVAGSLALHRLDVRSAHTASRGGRALLVWLVEPLFGSEVDRDRLTADIRRALSGTLDLRSALQRREDDSARRDPYRQPGAVRVMAHASRSATVIEVRADDRPGTLYRLTRALSGTGVDIASAHLESRGANVVDTFYVTAPGGGPLDSAAASAVVAALEAVLADS